MAIPVSDFKDALRDVVRFSRHLSFITLRAYQAEVARAIVDSVTNKLGLTFVVMFPRQSGKNELQAQIETYLLALYSRVSGEIVKISPTWKPQSQNAMRRLERILKRNTLTCLFWSHEQGYIYRIWNACIYFLSGNPSTNIVGATASTLLECDEAQDVLMSKWDKDVAPMAASKNATRVFWGTAWTSQTLLARELRAAEEAEQRDGLRRVFRITADEVRAEVPAYGKFVDEQIARLGRNHPLVRTQFFSEEIDAQGGMFPPERRALVQGAHECLLGPADPGIYALLIDVAGEDEAVVEGLMTRENAVLQNPGRDSTALTVVEVDLTSLADELIHAPTYRVVRRYLWTGTKHATLYGSIKALADHWHAARIVIDATGVGAGLYSFLDKALPGKVIPYVFSAKSKSDLGRGFIAAIETGRFKDFLLPPATRLQPPAVFDFGQADFQATFQQQLEACQSTILEGPGKLMRWGVPDGTRDPRTGELVHDDLALSAALCVALDGESWGLGLSDTVQPTDILAEMRQAY